MSTTKRNYIRCTKRGKCKTARPLTAEEALAILESAVSYCQQAGLKIGAANGDNGTLGLFIPNVHYILTDNGTRAAFRLSALSAHRTESTEHNGTSGDAVKCPNCDAAMKPHEGGRLKCTRCYYFLEEAEVNARIGTAG